MDRPTTQKSEAQAAPSGALSEAMGWTNDHLLKPVSDDVLKPIANSLLVQPYDAIANVVNLVASPLDKQLLPKLDQFTVPEAKFMSPGWFAQNISGGLATAAVFAAVGKGTGAGLGKLGLEGTLGSVVASQHTAMILGGTLYEGARDPNAGESHLGNAVGGALAFSVFEGGNTLGANWGVGKYGARVITGGLGMSLGRIASQGIAQHDLPSWQDIGKTAVTGGAMNLLLPTLQRFGAGARETSADTTTRSNATDSAYRPPLAGGLKLTPTSFRPADLMLRLGDENDVTTDHAPKTEVPSPVDTIPSGFSNARVERIPMTIGADPAAPRTFASRQDYADEGRLINTPNMRIMDVDGHPGTEVAMPAESSTPISAQSALDALNSVPDMRLIQRLTLIDQTHPEEEWLRQEQGNPSLTVNAEAVEPGEIRVYKPGLPDLQGNVDHEWNHLLRDQSPAAASIFDKVGNFEPVQTSVNAPFPNLEADEVWSYMGEHLAAMPTSPGDALMTASANPIRSSIWAKAVADRMATLPENERGTTYDSHQSLLKFVDQSVKPEAMKSLKQYATTGDAAQQARAQAIIQFLNPTH